MIPPGIEPGTLSVLDSRDNRYTMESQTPLLGQLWVLKATRLTSSNFWISSAIVSIFLLYSALTASTYKYMSPENKSVSVPRFFLILHNISAKY